MAGDSIRLNLPSDLGEASFAGVLDSDTISGTFNQRDMEGSFELHRIPDIAVEEIPYTASEVTIEGEDVSLAGTLTIPEGEGPFPGVILLTGSGLQGRDENIFGFQVFGGLADHLTRSGIAVLRCDDRGYGESTGPLENLTDSVITGDAALMLDLMLSQQDVDPEQVGILGHSEGSTVAFMVASLNPGDVAFVVSMAGPSISGYQVLLGQVETLGLQSGLTVEEVARKVEVQREIMDIILAGNGNSELEELLRSEIIESLRELSEEDLAAIGDFDAYVESVVAQTMTQVGSDWFLNFLLHDPADEISVVSCPVLALYGGLDVQVPPDRNLESMETALAENPSAIVMVFDGANHLFQAAVTGSVEEYTTLEPEFTEGFQLTVSDWILEVTTQQ